jgi:multiple sugar transport system permease protein
MNIKLTPIQRKRYFWAFLLSLPALLGLLLFHLWPVFEIFRSSLFKINIYTGQDTWRGLGNYATAAQDPMLGRSLIISLKFFLMKVPIQIALGLGLALLIKTPRRGTGFVRTVILLPTVTSMVVASTVWGFMYHPSNGLINSFLETLNLPNQPFLTSASQALPSIAVITVWKEVGLSMIFYLAGLMNIPEVYYEAAEVDGANRWQTFLHITIPLLKRTTAFVLITSTISAFKVFVPVKVLTGGGPENATNVIVQYIYDLAFNFSRMGYATTVSVILAVILLVISVLQLRSSQEQT